jgi:hypothetical protein
MKPVQSFFFLTPHHLCDLAFFVDGGSVDIKSVSGNYSTVLSESVSLAICIPQHYQ